MQVGDLVKITRAGVGVPIGTVGLILNTVHPEKNKFNAWGEIVYHEIQLFISGIRAPRPLRRLPRDLEIVSNSLDN